jgi:amidophosphoribosyltransferase
MSNVPASIHEIGVEIQPKPREECGVLGIWLSEAGEAQLHNEGIELEVDGELQRIHSIVDLGYIALKRQAHRGRQNTGMAVSVDGSNIQVIRGKGGPEEAFENGALLQALPRRARFLVAQNRYTTNGGPEGAQPVTFGDFALAVNGEFTNHSELAERGTRGDQPSDSWVHGSLVADDLDAGFTLPGALIESTDIAQGAYSITAMHRGNMVGMRDPRGIRPLVFGPLRDWGHVFASETPTMAAIGASYDRTVKHGELVTVSDKGLQSIKYANLTQQYCALEGIYLSDAEHLSVRPKRYRSGLILAQESPVPNADVVIPILGSAQMAAAGYADGLGIPYVDILRKIKQVRAFMASGDRKEVARSKLAVDMDKLRGVFNELFEQDDIDLDRLKEMVAVVVDDTIVRGDTGEVVCEMLSPYFKEVHLRIASPEIVDNCDLGVDLKDKGALSANRMTAEEYCLQNGIASLAHLSMRGLHKAYGKKLCTGCFGGKYPFTVPADAAATLVRQGS